jgi:plasmid stabilization system protein ParE
MNLPVILSPKADEEFEEAATWYDRHTGLGKRFMERTQQALDRIGAMPELHAMIYRDIRRARIAGFPYNILYRILADRIEVVAVFHHKRDPKIWQSRA